tara:strand:+ start:104 stop:304 length:201 start_codon:yes stop_codon:yes gene_type:complete
MTESQIIIALALIALSILAPIVYSYNKKIKNRNLDEKLKESIYVTEKEKIRVYLDNINETTRRKHR